MPIIGAFISSLFTKHLGYTLAVIAASVFVGIAGIFIHNYNTAIAMNSQLKTANEHYETITKELKKLDEMQKKLNEIDTKAIRDILNERSVNTVNFEKLLTETRRLSRDAELKNGKPVCPVDDGLANTLRGMFEMGIGKQPNRSP